MVWRCHGSKATSAVLGCAVAFLAVALARPADTGSAQGPERLEPFEFALIGDLGYAPAQESLSSRT